MFRYIVCSTDSHEMTRKKIEYLWLSTIKKRWASRFPWRTALFNTHCLALKWNVYFQKIQTQFDCDCATFLLEVISNWRDHAYCIWAFTLIKWTMVFVIGLHNNLCKLREKAGHQLTCKVPWLWGYQFCKENTCFHDVLENEKLHIFLQKKIFF